MGRECADCGCWKTNSNFSRNQWLKGDGYSRCKSCVNPPTYQCHECYRVFSDQNELNMHMQVHRPKNVACPICGEVRFKSAANAVQHVESGYCTGCRGSRDNARQQIHDFVYSKGAMRPYMTETPLLEYGGGSRSSAVPDFPYRCPQCDRSFRNLSQLMQHNDNKHNNRSNLIGY